MAEAPEALVAAFYAAYARRDAAAAAMLYEPEGWHAEGDGRRRQGRTALREGLEKFFAMLPDVGFDLRETIDAGRTAAVVYTMRGHLAFDLGGQPTRGRRIELPGVHVFEFGGAAIAGTRDLWDAREFRRQAGLVAP